MVAAPAAVHGLIEVTRIVRDVEGSNAPFLNPLDNEQLVGLLLDALPRRSETLRDLVEERSERFLLAAAAHLELRDVKLPAAAHRGVQNRLGSLSVWRAIRSFDQRHDLRRLHGKGDVPTAWTSNRGIAHSSLPCVFSILFECLKFSSPGD